MPINREQPAHYVLMHPDIANDIDWICSRVRGKNWDGQIGRMNQHDVLGAPKESPHMTAEQMEECVREAAREAITSPNSDIMTIFDNEDSVVDYVMIRLIDEHIQAVKPTDFGIMKICLRLAYGDHDYDIAWTTGQTQRTIRAIEKDYLGFILLVKEKAPVWKGMTDEIRKLWEDWKKDNDPHPDSLNAGTRVCWTNAHDNDKIVYGVFVKRDLRDSNMLHVKDDEGEYWLVDRWTVKNDTPR